MEKEFVPYDLALKLKVLGFTDLCMYAWCEMGGFNRYTQERIDIYYALKTNGNPFGLFSEGHNWNRTIEGSNKNKIQCSAPLWQQAFPFVLKLINNDIRLSNKMRNRYVLDWTENGWAMDDNNLKTTYETNEEVLEKLIELVENK